MSTIKITQLPASGTLTGAEVVPIVQNDTTVQATTQAIADLAGGGLSGTNFIYVAADGTDTANATALSAAYTTAQGMSPSATNRITIVAAPGYYNFGSTAFTMSTQYIDLVSLDGNRSVIFNSSNPSGTISITANDVFVKGVDVESKNFTITSGLNLLKIENCKGGDYSFGGDATFGSNPIDVSGTFTDCQGGDYSFGYFGTPSGIFINCQGGNYSFGSDGDASGLFKNCQGGDYSFGGGVSASGTFTNCQGGEFSFGGVFSGTLSGKLYYCRLTTGNFQTPSGGGEIYASVDGNGQLVGGGSISGTNTIFVQANGSATDNATELQTAYDLAKTLSPTSTNRITIVASCGYYDFQSTQFVMDTQYIDLVSLDGNRSVIFNSADPAGTISITANDVFVKGVNVLTKNFTIANNLNLLKVENCQGGEYSFGGLYGTVSGTFTNCIGGDASFGGDFGTADGIFTNCVGGEYSFGGYGTASGTFTDCVGGEYSFGGYGTVSGTFTNCIGGIGSFGGTASGTFTNCVGGEYSFGGYGGTASGTFTNCVGDFGSFGGYFGTASGTFTNCVGGNSSFGGSGTLEGKLYYCRLTAGTFETVSGGGRTIYCIDGNDNTNNQ